MYHCFNFDGDGGGNDGWWTGVWGDAHLRVCKAHGCSSSSHGNGGNVVLLHPAVKLLDQSDGERVGSAVRARRGDAYLLHHSYSRSILQGTGRHNTPPRAMDVTVGPWHDVDHLGRNGQRHDLKVVEGVGSKRVRGRSPVLYQQLEHEMDQTTPAYGTCRQDQPV